MRILAINPGGTSTKIAVYEDTDVLFKDSVTHSGEDLKKYAKVFDQYEYRRDLILDALTNHNIPLESLSAVVGRGGLMQPIQGGVYAVNDLMIDDLRNAISGEHPCNLGAVLARDIARPLGLPSFVVDPVSVDEFIPEARVSGMSDLPKASWLHTLNHKAVARKVSTEMGRKYEDVNLVVAHLGSGVTVAAHRKGKAIDGSGGRVDGAFSPERSGGLPTYPLIELCYSGKYTAKEMVDKVSSVGGMYDYLGTKDVQEIQGRADRGERKAQVVLNAFIHQIVKEIGAHAAILAGKVDRIIITGGIAQSERITAAIREKVEFIAPVTVVPGEEELESLVLGALRVLRGEETAKDYPGRVVSTPWDEE